MADLFELHFDLGNEVKLDSHGGSGDRAGKILQRMEICCSVQTEVHIEDMTYFI